jgi:hypothetical protein
VSLYIGRKASMLLFNKIKRVPAAGSAFSERAGRRGLFVVPGFTDEEGNHIQKTGQMPV